MRNRIIFSGCLLTNMLLSSCGDSEKHLEVHHDIAATDETLQARSSCRPFSKIPSVKYLLDANQLWYGGSGVGLFFERDRANFVFSLKCDCSFPIGFIDDTLTVYWSENFVCPINKTLTSSLGIDRHPLVGLPFAKVDVVDDSTLRVNYYYPQWIEAANRQVANQDTIFPVIFRRDQ